MRAAVLHGQQDIRIQSIEPAPLQPGEVRVRIGAALTCGTDLKVFKRGYHAKMLQPPCVFGHEFAGTIIELGANVVGWQIGDRIVSANSAPCGECFYCHHDQPNLCDDLLFLNGAYAETIVIPQRIVEKNLLRLVSSTPFSDAALTEPLACVVQGVHDLSPQPSERMLIIGAGPIGLMFVRLASHFGLEVTVAGRGQARLLKAAEFGAFSIDIPRGSSGLEEIAAVRKRFDLVVEAVGQPECWETALHVVRKGGRVNLFGGCPAGTVASLDTGRMHYSGLRLLASFHHTPIAIREALQYIEQGIISAKDFVTGETSLTSLPQLFQEMAAGNRAIKTKVDVHS